MVKKADNSGGRVFFVDDEPAVCAAVRETLEASNIPVRCFARAAECLTQLRSQRCDLLITDLKMPEKNGMQLLEEVKELAPWVPVLIVTGYGDIPAAVKAIKGGGADFIEKPLGKDGFVRKVNSLLEQSRTLRLEGFWALTRMEIHVLKRIVEGRSNSEIAALMKRSVRTVESHRAALMQKLGVHTMVELLKLAAAAGLVGLSTRQLGSTGQVNDGSSDVAEAG
jgi:two-component system response regulator TtrR